MQASPPLLLLLALLPLLVLPLLPLPLLLLPPLLLVLLPPLVLLVPLLPLLPLPLALPSPRMTSPPPSLGIDVSSPASLEVLKMSKLFEHAAKNDVSTAAASAREGLMGSPPPRPCEPRQTNASALASLSRKPSVRTRPASPGDGAPGPRSHAAARGAMVQGLVLGAFCLMDKASWPTIGAFSDG